MATITVTLDEGFGYVLLVFILSIVLIQWLGANVFRSRKKHDVSYPTMYSDKSPMFNCIQRAHQNTLEVYPMFLALLFVAGVFSPKLSAASGLLWIISRVVYAYGYYTGNPEKRNRGAFGYIGLITLLVNVIRFAVSFCPWIMG